jgi:hypothetical protein
MTKSYAPTRPLVRAILVAAALLATVSTGLFVDGLAQHYAVGHVAAALAAPQVQRA